VRLAKLELDIAPVSLGGFVFSRRVVDLEKYEDGGNHCFWAGGLRSCARPPLFGEVSHYLALIPGESWDSGLGPGLDALAVYGSSRRICYAIKGTASRFEIRADNGRFRKPECSHTTFVWQEENRKVGNFFQDPFAVRTRFAFVSLRQACFRLVLPFFDPRVFPLGSAWKVPF